MNTTLTILVLYLVGVFALAWYFSRNQNLEAYFLNNKKTGLWLMTLSTIASVIGAGGVVGVVAEVYNTGISYGVALPISYIVGMIVMGLIAHKIKELGDKHDARTLVDIFASRYDTKNKILVGILQMGLLTMWIGTLAIAVGSLASVLIDIPFSVALTAAAGTTILYTAVGGLQVDLITDFIQFWVIMFVFGAMAVIGFTDFGGISPVIQQLPAGHLDIFGFEGPTFFFGLILFSGFVYAGNTSHWQRIFSAESPEVARKSFFLTIPFLAGFALVVLFCGLMAASSLSGSGIDPDQALFQLIENVLTPELAGIGFAAVLAIIMSSIDSLLIGGSTIIHKALFGGQNLKGEKKLLYARGLTTLFGIAGFVVAFLVPDIVTLSLYLGFQATLFVPPILAALYSQEISADATFYSLLISSILIYILVPLFGRNMFLVAVITAVGILFIFDKMTATKRVASK